MRSYTALALLASAATVALEVLWLRTGVFRMRAYWVTMAIVVFFQVLVDGWLTKLSSPVVIYNPDHFSGLRPILDIPVEDFPYGFALVTLAILVWEKVASPAADVDGVDPVNDGR